ncbi:MAG TPA: DUF192 domain-containing protein [Acidimicrobiales bacterium]|jgi:hypothetical protein
MRSGWLLREGDVVCALEMTESARERRRGFSGRASADGAGALHIAGARSVHSLGRRIDIDVAFLSDELVVMRVRRLAPWRVCLGGRGACSVLEAEGGALERWGVQVGDQLDIREVT